MKSYLGKVNKNLHVNGVTKEGPPCILSTSNTNWFCF